LLAAVALAGVTTAPTCTESDLYPTDACVVAKLEATASYCREAVGAWNRGDPSQGADAQLEAARGQLATAWSSAEAKSLAKGASCADTTATANEMIATVDGGAAAIAAAIAESSGEDAAGEQACESRRNKIAADACHHLVRLEGNHIGERYATDRGRDALQSRRDTVNEWVEAKWSDGAAQACIGGPSGAEAVALVGEAVQQAVGQALVSPRVASEWTMITPDAQVPYQGKTLEPICSKGTPWVFFVKRGTVNKTLMYYQGGGACWDFVTCSAPTHKTAAGAGDNPANASNGFANLNNPDNPYKDWNAVFVPYCTGDVHWGDAVVDHTRAGLHAITHHKGFVNAQVAEKWAREHFVNPDQVFVTGSSAGAYGAIVNSLQLMENVWPSSDFAVLGDAGNGVITQEFLENDLAKWGIEQNLPDWIPGLNLPLTELTAADLYTEAALYYPTHRFANYTTAYDGGQGGQIGFYNVMLSGLDIGAWLRWWVPSCEWNEQMRALVADTASQAPNYRYYIGSGSRHTMWGNAKVYTDTTGNVPTIASWLRAMLDGAPEWLNVDSDEPGTLLPGDPRPDPAEYPYEEGGIINCGG
jgi:hypothetical protein